jgi:hypothetical protein
MLTTFGLLALMLHLANFIYPELLNMCYQMGWEDRLIRNMGGRRQPPAFHPRVHHQLF